MNLIKFETRSVGPTSLPAFPYIASSITHQAVQYEALATVDEVVAAWPDAVVIQVTDPAPIEAERNFVARRLGTATSQRIMKPSWFSGWLTLGK